MDFILLILAVLAFIVIQSIISDVFKSLKINHKKNRFKYLVLNFLGTTVLLALSFLISILILLLSISPIIIIWKIC